MKQLLLITAAIVALACSSSDTDKEVYICISKSAEVYHFNKDCRGLNRCTHEVKKVSLSEAKEKYSRRLCGYED